MSNKFIELLVIIALSIFMVAPALVVKNSLIGEGVDLYGTIWFYEWIYDSIMDVLQNISCLLYIGSSNVAFVPFTSLFLFALHVDK